MLNGGLAAVLAPQRVARVGAPDQPGSVGRMWDNLADFPGEVLPDCQAATLGGRLAYADLRDVSARSTWPSSRRPPPPCRISSAPPRAKASPL